MVKAHDVRQQLRRIGADYHFWGVAELRELPKILFDKEQIHHVINGRYDGGFATLCATDIRVLLIDKKPFFLTLEDVRYDMVSDVMFNHRLMNASLILGTVHNSISFIGFNKTRLRQMTNFIQQRVMDFRRHQGIQHQSQPDELPLQPHLTEQLLPNVPAEPAMESAAYQPIPTAATPTADVPLPPAINPYRMPTMIRRRTSRY